MPRPLTYTEFRVSKTSMLCPKELSSTGLYLTNRTVNEPGHTNRTYMIETIAAKQGQYVIPKGGI